MSEGGPGATAGGICSRACSKDGLTSATGDVLNAAVGMSLLEAVSRVTPAMGGTVALRRGGMMGIKELKVRVVQKDRIGREVESTDREQTRRIIQLLIGVTTIILEVCTPLELS